MAKVVGHVELIAGLVTERVAKLLQRRVCACDERDEILACSDSSGLPVPIGDAVLDAETAQRVPVRLGERDCELLIEEAASGEAISPRLVADLVTWISNQAGSRPWPPDQRESKNRSIHMLPGDVINDEEETLREGHILGIDLAAPRAVILIDAANFLLARDAGDTYEVAAARSQRRVEAVTGSVMNFFHLPSDTICAYIGFDEIAVLKASSTPDLAAGRRWRKRIRGMKIPSTRHGPISRY
jgi:carbohydrate diacid regulator